MNCADGGRRVNRKRVERIMRERCIVGITRRRRRSLTKPDTTAAPAPHLIGRDFTAPAPGTVGSVVALVRGRRSSVAARRPCRHRADADAAGGAQQVPRPQLTSSAAPW